MYVGDYAENLGDWTPSSNTLARGESLALAIFFGWVSYKAYKGLIGKTKSRRKSSRKIRHKTTSSVKKHTSRFLRRAAATTVPMRFFKTHSSRKRTGLKAEDWVNEQLKLMSLNKKRKKA